MKIALIHVKVVEAPDPPLGLMYIGSLLKQSGHQVKLWDEYKNDDFVKEVIDFFPQLIGFSVLSSQVAFLIPIVKRLKLATGAFIVLGGIHATVLPREILFQAEADVAVIGEGELTMSELVEKFNQGTWRGIDGIAYYENGKFCLNKPREFIKDLDILPFPDYFMLDVSKTFIPPLPPIPLPPPHWLDFCVFGDRPVVHCLTSVYPFALQIGQSSGGPSRAQR